MQEIYRRCGFDPWVGKIPWKRAWQPTPVFLPGKSHGQRSLAGYSPWGHKESDITEVTKHALTHIPHTHTTHPSQTHTPICAHFVSTYHTHLTHTSYILPCSLFHDLYPLRGIVPITTWSCFLCVHFHLHRKVLEQVAYLKTQKEGRSHKHANECSE